MAARTLVLPLALAAVVAACGDDQTPTSPTPAPPASSAVVTVSAAPNPLTAVADPGGVAERYRVSANLTFQETAGKAATVTVLKVTVWSTASPPWSSTSNTNVSIAVDAKGTAAYTLPTTFDAAAADPAARWQLEVTAADTEGKAVSVAPVQVPMLVPPRMELRRVVDHAGGRRSPQARPGGALFRDQRVVEPAGPAAGRGRVPLTPARRGPSRDLSGVAAVRVAPLTPEPGLLRTAAGSHSGRSPRPSARGPRPA